MSIINEALKKVQRSLDQKDASLPLLEQKPSHVTPPEPPKAEPSASAAPLKTLATIEQEQKESELKRQPQLMPQGRPSSLTKLLKTYFFIFLFACSVLAFLYFAGYLKEIPFSQKFPRISAPPKSLNQHIKALFPRPSSSSSIGLNPVVSSGTIFPKVSSLGSQEDTSSGKKASPKNFVLKGIITKNNHQVALINDGIYEEGSTIEGVKVTSISSKEVTLMDGERTITLTIEGNGY